MRRKTLSPNNPRSYSSSPKKNQFQNRPLTSSLTKPASNPSQYEKFLHTSYMLSKIKQSIKQNNIKYLLGQKSQKLRTEPQDNKQWQINNIHENLIDIRRKYDAVKRDRVLRMQRTQALKEKVRMHTEEQKQWRIKISSGKLGFRDGQGLMSNNKLQLQFKKTDAKTLEHMQQRLKQDIKYYKSQIIIKKRQLKCQHFNLQSLRSKQQNLQKQTKNSELLLQKLNTHLNNERNQQSSHLYNIQQMVHNKHLQQQIQQSRIRYQQQEEEKALLAKNQQQNNWYQLMLVHLMVKRMLLNKMEIQIRKFGGLEKAWRSIKAKTDVRTTDVFVDKFMNRESIYGELLGQVSRSKDKHTQYTQQHAKLFEINQDLQEENEELMNLQYTIMSQKQKKEDSFKKQMKQKQNLQQSIEINIKKRQFKQWILRQLLKFSSLNKKRYPFYKDFYTYSIPALFNRYVNCINDKIDENQTQLNSIQHQQQEGLISQVNAQTTVQVTLENKSMMASTNAKTRADRQRNQGKFMKNKSQVDGMYGNKIDNSKQIKQLDNIGRDKDRQKDRQNSYQYEDQDEALASIREEILRKNQRYMRDLRMKYREIKKNKL